MNSLFGLELPTPVSFVVAFIVVLALIGGATWLVRRLGSSRLDAARGRQPRLAVIDSAAVDSRRKLVIIRRDNVEHLLMIGGPTDVVVETNIVRASAAAARDVPAARNGTVATPSPEPAAPKTIQPEPTPSVPAAPVRIERSPKILSPEPSWNPPTEPVVQSIAPAPPVRATRAIEAPTVSSIEEPRPTTAEPQVVSQSHAAEPSPSAPLIPSPPAAPTVPPAAATPQHRPPVTAAEQSIAEMAQKLEAALRRPVPSKSPTENGAGDTKANRTSRLTITPAARSNIPMAGNQATQDLEQEMSQMPNKPGAS